ncbi:unnamed protein product, partial [Sphacelaria rigidula]
QHVRTSSCSPSTPGVGGPHRRFVHGGSKENSAFGRAAAQLIAISRDHLDVDMPPELAGACLQHWLFHEEADHGASTKSGLVTVGNKQQHQQQQLRFFLSPHAAGRDPAAASSNTLDDDSTSSEDGEDGIEY